jgi:hypothetical protein
MLKAKKDAPIEFEGDRTEEGFIDFLKQHSSAKIDVTAEPTERKRDDEL